MATTNDEMRFGFGRNWHRFIKKNFSEERLEAAKKRLLGFCNLSDMRGLRMLDIGCGSGIHSFAAYKSGADQIFSFDYDVNSVAATKELRKRAGDPANWTVEQGDVLDQTYLAKLGKFNFVYSWGVLHHTGRMWEAVRNAQQHVEDGGLFFIALYSADADFQPSKEYWLDIKKKYNQSSELGKTIMVWQYVWEFGIYKDFRKVPALLNQIVTYRLQRGMDYFTDVRDWLGGWPMEYAADQDVVDLLEGEYGFELINCDTGHACSEFLFRRSGAPATRTNVKMFMERKKSAILTPSPNA